MTERWAAVLAAPPDGSTAAPPRVGADRFALALLEDVYEVLEGLTDVTAAIATVASYAETAATVSWPGTPMLPVPDGDSAERTLAALDALAGRGAGAAVVVAPDAPDLPPLLLGKLYSGLTGNGEVAVCPAQDGGLVAVAVRAPVPDWLREARVGLDSPDALPRLRAAAGRGRLVVGPGWHRLRRAGDTDRLDRGLEGWEATRLLLS